MSSDLDLGFSEKKSKGSIALDDPIISETNDSNYSNIASKSFLFLAVIAT